MAELCSVLGNQVFGSGWVLPGSGSEDPLASVESDSSPDVIAQNIRIRIYNPKHMNVEIFFFMWYCRKRIFFWMLIKKKYEKC